VLAAYTGKIENSECINTQQQAVCNKDLKKVDSKSREKSQQRVCEIQPRNKCE